MKRFLQAGVLILALGLVVGCGGEKHAINGQVFIATNEGTALKLPLVTVELFDEQGLRDVLRQKMEAAKSLSDFYAPRAREAAQRLSGLQPGNDVYEGASKEERRLRGLANYAISTGYLFDGLPKALLKTKTDADGKFVFKALPGQYAVVAFGSRMAGDQREYYSWVVKVGLHDEDATVNLDNDNVSTQDVGGENMDSLVQTAPDEAGVMEAVGGRRLDVLMTAMVKENADAAAAGKAMIEQDRAMAAAQQEADKRALMLEAFRKDPAAAQREAVRLYPDLGTAGSDLNKEFLARMAEYRSDNPDYFKEPDWPIRLAGEIAGAPVSGGEMGPSAEGAGSPAPAATESPAEAAGTAAPAPEAPTAGAQ